MIMADMFPPFSIIRTCVFIFHEQHNHGWCVPATFDSQRVCIPIPWAASWSRLTCSRHLRLSGSVYLYFMSSRIMADMFPPHSILRPCVIISISFATPSRLTCSRHFDFQEVRIFHEQHNHVWHFPATFFFGSQRVCTPISFVAPSWLTCSLHFRLLGSPYLYFMSNTIMADMFTSLDSQRVRNPIPWAALWSRLTCSCHFQLLESPYLYFMSSTIMADMFPPLSILRQYVIIPISFATTSRLICSPFSIIRKCVFIFYEQQYHGWHVPATINSQAVRNISHSFATTSRLIVPAIFWLSASAYLIFHEQHNYGWRSCHF